MTECIQVTTAIDSKEGAQKIAQTLVERRLAACVHVAGRSRVPTGGRGS